ncbi:ERF family protein [Paenochrobactrum glaciei]|uniref:ERF family protein n=1 Tax=Paenochrobactrum glaciei TaxID=486407 RepID=A0ABP3R7A1_9HYPH
MSAALEIHTETVPAQSSSQSSAALTPMQMAYQLIQGGADLGSVKEMLAVSKELAAEQAKRSFSVAIAGAKAELRPIVKNRDGHNTKYADFAAIASAIDPVITKHGLSYRFRTRQIDNRAEVTCIIEHVDGHSEENTLSAPSDNTGNKNAIQAIGSTLTYLQRYSLIQAFGLAIANDDDGRRSGLANAETISKEQVKNLLRLIEETDTDIEQFCKRGKVEALPDILAADYENAVYLLEEKKKRMAQ